MSDTINTAIAQTKLVVAARWRALVTMAAIMGLVAAGMSLLVDRLGVMETIMQGLQAAAAKDPVLGSILGIYVAVLQFIISIAIVSPVLGLVTSYYFHRFADESPAFATLPRRGFARWILGTTANMIVAIIVFYLLMALCMGVLIGVIVALFKLNTVPTILLGVLAIFLAIAVYIIAILLMIALFGQIMMLSLFRKVRPLVAIRYSFLTTTRPAGTRSGGLFGLNLWHFVGASLVGSIVAGFIPWFLIIISALFLALVPATMPVLRVPLQAVLVAVSAAGWSCCIIMQMIVYAVYLSETLTLGDNGVAAMIRARVGSDL